MRKRRVCLFCCAALFALLPAMASAADTYRMAGFDGEGSTHQWKDNSFFTRMQSRTGISFTFEEYTDPAKWQAAKAALLAGGDLPDVLFKADLSTAEQIAGAESGVLIDLKPLLSENAPNLWALLSAHPDWLEAVTLPDGKITALPSVNELPAENAMWINRQWLDALGLNAPTDWQSLTDTLLAFKTGDPNGNGAADEIPLSFLGPWDLKFLTHAFGLAANDYNVYLDADGAVRFAPAQDAYLDMVRSLADLYAQGLLDHNGFYTADTLRKITDSKALPTYGMFFGPNPLTLLPYETASQYELLMPLTYGGRQIYRELAGPVTGGAFAITSACDDPAALLRWVDTLYGEEGAAEAMAGYAGQDYTLSAEGRWRYADGSQDGSFASLDTLSVYDTGVMPWRFPVSFYGRYDDALLSSVQAQQLALQPYLIRPFPACVLTVAQQDAILPVQNALGRYVDESLARFVLGEWNSRDADTVASYLSGLGANGENEMVAFWQGIADSLAK